MKDLVVVVADRDTEQAISALLRRNQALQIRAVDFDIGLTQLSTAIRRQRLPTPAEKLWATA